MSDAYVQREADERADDDRAREREIQERLDRFIEKNCACGDTFSFNCAVHNPLISSRGTA